MQVNSAQDYLTAQKRRIVAATFTQDPPPAHRKYNYVVTSVLANRATVYNRFVAPASLAPGAVAPGGKTTTSTCCVVAQGATPLPGSLV